MTEARAQQIFKNRKAAHRWLQAENIPVGQTKFYEDCDHFGLIQPDKSIQLADLLAYVKTELKTGPAGPSRDLGAEEYQRQKADEELKNLRLKNEKIELENRKEDRKWILRSESEDHEAALVGLLRDALKHRVRIKATSLLRTAGGQPSREPEFIQGLLSLIEEGFNELADGTEFDVEFEEEAFEPEEKEEE